MHYFYMKNGRSKILMLDQLGGQARLGAANGTWNAGTFYSQKYAMQGLSTLSRPLSILSGAILRKKNFIIFIDSASIEYNAL